MYALAFGIILITVVYYGTKALKWVLKQKDNDDDLHLGV